MTFFLAGLMNSILSLMLYNASIDNHIPVSKIYDIETMPKQVQIVP